MTERIKCRNEECAATIQPSTAIETGGLCKPCEKKIKHPEVDSRFAFLGNLIGNSLFLCVIAVALACWFYFFSDLFGSLTLPGKLERNGIEARAVFWEVEVEEQTYGSSIPKRIVYNKTYKARFFAQGNRLCQIDMEKGVDSYPFMKVLATRQPFLIRYLPDDPFAYTYAFRHDKDDMTKFIADARSQALLKTAVIRADPIVLSTDNQRGFAIVHVSNEMLNHSWLGHHLILARTKELGLSDQGRSDAFVGLTASEYSGGMTSQENLHPEGSSAQDALAVVNLVEPDDEVEFRLRSSVRGSDGRKFLLTATFFLNLSRYRPVNVTISDVRTIAASLQR